MRFFFDRCMAIRIYQMAKILETKHDLCHHDDDGRFNQFTKDVEWISALSKDPIKPIVLTGDCRILKRPDEVRELRKSGLTYFCFADHFPDFEVHEQTWKFFKVWPEIIKEATVTHPTVFEIKKGSSLKIEKYVRTLNA